VWSQRWNTPAAAVAVDPANADLVTAVAEDGLFQSGDGGISWAALART
jgi:hypothetical protein